MTAIQAYVLAKKIAESAASGIANIAYADEVLTFTLQDGQQLTVDVPLPKDGKDGRDGIDGKDGKDGTNGVNGKDGINGQDGADGISVTKVYIDTSNHLICEMSDETKIDAGALPSGGGGSSIWMTW